MPSNPQDLASLSRLLEEALDLDPADAEAWLRSLPPEHAHLRPDLASMLAVHREPSRPDFLAQGPKFKLVDETVAQVGELVGPYRLISQVGRGGMGEVWLAERADGTLKRQIALKLPRLAWGSGLAQRMARERDIGALLEHPNIARLYDAGVDAKGRPYLALEYIAGESLDAWCAKGTTVRQRLQLFAQIARAVAYAHGRLVVHRDLKPSNVIVTADGRACLLDFGIAKLLDDAAADGDLTQEQGRVLTPRYASPEQIEGKPLTVESDIYSLGVLLYEMLSGCLPHASERTTPVALEAAVLDADPPLASTRSRDRSLAFQLRGEIDAILAKTLRREPGQRYSSAGAFADDVENHLKGERVMAQPDSMGYRIGKTLRRYRLVFAAAGAVFAAVLLGGTVSLVQARRANVAAERARIVKEFVVDVFKVNERGNAGNSELRQLPAELLLEHGAKLIEVKFAGQPELQAELYGVVGGIFADMGANALAADYATHQVEALVVINAEPAEQAKAALLLAQALLAEGRLADAGIRAQRALDLAEPDSDLRAEASVVSGRILLNQGHVDDATKTLDRADAILHRQQKPTVAAARAAALRGALLVKANRFGDALPLYRSAISIASAVEGPLSPTTTAIQLDLQWLYIVHGQGEESKAPRASALASLRASGRAGEIRAALAESQAMAQMYAAMTPHEVSFQEARDTVEADLKWITALGSAVPASVRAQVQYSLGKIYLTWGDLASAESPTRDSVGVLLAGAESPRDRFYILFSLGFLDLLLGRHEDAAGEWAQIIELRKQDGGGNHPWASFDYAFAAMNLAMEQRFDEAEALLNSAPKFEDLKGGVAEDYRWVIPRYLAAVRFERGDAGAALKALPAESEDPTLTLVPWDDSGQRGEILCAVGRRLEGLQKLEKMLSAAEGTVSPNHPALARAQAVTGLCHLAEGHRARATALAALARHAFDAQPNVSPYFKKPLADLDARLAPAKKAASMS